MSGHQKPADVKPADSPKPRMDPELQAMAKIDRILAEMDEGAALRVVTWVLTKRYPKDLKFSYHPAELKGANGHE